MKKVAAILFFVSLFGCQDVVEIDPAGEEPRLIFDAILRVNVDAPNENRIKISTTNSFFDEIQPSLLDRIQLLNETLGGVSFYAPDSLVPGSYIPGADNIPDYDNILLVGEPDPEHRYILTFEYLDELYLAFYNYVPVTALTSVVQGDETLFDEDDIEIEITFTDPEDESNYYAFQFGDSDYIVFDDTFFDGQEYTFSYFAEENTVVNNQIEVKMLGLDEPLFNYLSQLIDQSEEVDNPFFQIPVSTVRGNILKVEGINNIDTFDNVGRPQEFVLGYFAYIQERSFTLTVE